MVLTAMVAIAIAANLCAGEKKSVTDAKPDEDAAKQSHRLTVAILDFDVTAPGHPKLGKEIVEALTARLAVEPGIEIVDRSSVADILHKSELNPTGVVNVDQGGKIGKLVGAKVLVTGRVFLLDNQLFFAAKLIGTETSLVEGVLLKGGKDGGIGDLVMQLSDKVAKRLRHSGGELVAQDGALQDPLPGLRKALAGRKLPTVAVRVVERHITPSTVRRVVPAAEAELQRILREAGFTVMEGGDNQIAEAGVKYLIDGEAFSEFATRIATLVTCTARVEIKVTDRMTGEVAFTDSQTTRTIDPAEDIACKNALQKASHALGIQILTYFERSLPP
jgi:hypothetical protein